MSRQSGFESDDTKKMSTTWRIEPFEKGRSYRVRKSFAALRDSFREGEILRYQKSAYSRYDGMSGFLFGDSEGKIRCWDIHDDERLEVWSEFFERYEKTA